MLIMPLVVIGSKGIKQSGHPYMCVCVCICVSVSTFLHLPNERWYFNKTDLQLFITISGHRLHSVCFTLQHL